MIVSEDHSTLSTATLVCHRLAPRVATRWNLEAELKKRRPPGSRGPCGRGCSSSVADKQGRLGCVYCPLVTMIYERGHRVFKCNDVVSAVSV